MTDSLYLSVIIPSYKSSGILEKNLGILMSYLSKNRYTYEVIVVDDGSIDDDATKSVCQKLGCTFLQNEINLGKGAAVRKGMIHARGQFRIFTDADIPYEMDTIDVILNFLDTLGFDMVIGDRNLQDSEYFPEIPWLRRFASAFFTWIVGTIVTTNYYDTQCGIKGFKGGIADSVFKDTRINGFAFDVELVYFALKQQFKIKRIPVRLRNQEKSTVRVFHHGIGMFVDLFRIKINHLRGFYNG